ncbi:glycosyltransferase family 1 protein [Halorubrum sp. SS5]|nr:glycosyltransferase family 1 protein [Halorubrum sp. SS5]
MDIAYVTNVVYPFVTGGAEKRVHEIGTRLADRGHTVTIYGRHFWDGSKEREFAGMTLRGVSPERELYTGNRRSIYEALEFSKDLIRPLRRHTSEHDIIIASVFPYFPVLTAQLSTISVDLPIVTTWHEVWGEYWNDYLGYLAPFGKVVERITAQVPQYPIAVSSVTADGLTKLGPSREQITVVPNGINIDRIKEVEPTNDGFEIIFVGRLIKDKNVDQLIQAFDNVASNEPSITLGIIGDGPKKEALKQMAETCDNSNQITFLGFLDEYDDVLAHMKSANVFVSPSTREGFGITYLEAMAAGCNVIGANHPDSAASEVINDAGYVIEPTVRAITDTLEKVLDGKHPQKDPIKVAQQYDWDRVTDQAENAYQHAIDGTW